jgi:hypothetical protein
MNAERIKELRLAWPFRPFELVMSDGKKLPVNKAYHLAISPDGRFLVYSAPKGVQFLATESVSEAVVLATESGNGGGGP